MPVLLMHDSAAIFWLIIQVAIKLGHALLPNPNAASINNLDVNFRKLVFLHTCWNFVRKKLDNLIGVYALHVMNVKFQIIF